MLHVIGHYTWTNSSSIKKYDAVQGPSLRASYLIFLKTKTPLYTVYMPVQYQKSWTSMTQSKPKCFIQSVQNTNLKKTISVKNSTMIVRQPSPHKYSIQFI